MSIVLIAVGRVETEILTVLQTGISAALHCSVSRGAAAQEPVYALDTRRRQYLATTIVQALRKESERRHFDRILGVVDHDLYAPELNFVFGLASGAVAVIALARLRQGFYGLPEDPSLFQKRALTEAVHELGHTYGLPHCENRRCVMFFSNTLQDTDRKNSTFCRQCQEKLQ
jgi:archaemetzincin